MYSAMCEEHVLFILYIYVYTSHSDAYTLFKCCKTSESAQVFYCVNKTVLHSNSTTTKLITSA